MRLVTLIARRKWGIPTTWTMKISNQALEKIPTSRVNRSFRVITLTSPRKSLKNIPLDHEWVYWNPGLIKPIGCLFGFIWGGTISAKQTIVRGYHHIETICEAMVTWRSHDSSNTWRLIHLLSEFHGIGILWGAAGQRDSEWFKSMRNNQITLC